MSAHYCIAIAVNELKAVARGGPAPPAAGAAAAPSESPAALAATVVHAHEERVAALRSAGGASPVARSRARSIARSDADTDFAAAAAASAAVGLGHHSSAGSMLPSSPGHASSAHGEDESRRAAVSGGGLHLTRAAPLRCSAAGDVVIGADHPVDYEAMSEAEDESGWPLAGQARAISSARATPPFSPLSAPRTAPPRGRRPRRPPRRRRQGRRRRCRVCRCCCRCLSARARSP